jgi:AraC-like DNA-binding protein
MPPGRLAGHLRQQIPAIYYFYVMPAAGLLAHPLRSRLQRPIPQVYAASQCQNRGKSWLRQRRSSSSSAREDHQGIYSVDVSFARMGGIKVGSRLDRVSHWEEVAKKCGYCLQRMAQECGMSRQHLRRYFQQQLHLNPKTWLDDLRWRSASARLTKGEAIKVIAADLQFKHASHFSKFVKRMAHQTPREYQAKSSQSITKSSQNITNVPKG